MGSAAEGVANQNRVVFLLVESAVCLIGHIDGPQFLAALEPQRSTRTVCV
jgi:hypothetical protein